MQQQRRFDFGRVHVRAAGDDHVLGAAVDEQVAVVVEVAEIAERELLAPMDAVGLVRVVVIAEPDAVLHVDLADGAGRHLVAVVVEDQQPHAANRPTDGPRLLEPAVRLGDRRRALHAAVGLPDHRAPPRHHLRLHLGRTGRRGVHDGVETRVVVPLAHFGRQLKETVELRRHHVRGADAVLLDELQGALGFEAIHDHERVADVETAHVVAVRSTVEHAGADEHRTVERAEVERAAEEGVGVGEQVGVTRRDRTTNPLRPSGGAGRVHEQAAGPPIGWRRPRHGAAGRGERREAVDFADRQHAQPRPGASSPASNGANRAPATSTLQPE